MMWRSFVSRPVVSARYLFSERSVFGMSRILREGLERFVPLDRIKASRTELLIATTHAGSFFREALEPFADRSKAQEPVVDLGERKPLDLRRRELESVVKCNVRRQDPELGIQHEEGFPDGVDDIFRIPSRGVGAFLPLGRLVDVDRRDHRAVASSGRPVDVRGWEATIEALLAASEMVTSTSSTSPAPAASSGVTACAASSFARTFEPYSSARAGKVDRCDAAASQLKSGHVSAHSGGDFP